MVLVRQRFQYRDVTVVVGVGIAAVAAGADALQCVDDHQRGVGVLRKKVGELLLQPLADACGDGGEVQCLRRVVGDLKQAALDTGEAVLQAEVEHSASMGREVPHACSLRHLQTQPQSQPRFAHLRCSGKDV